MRPLRVPGARGPLFADRLRLPHHRRVLPSFPLPLLRPDVHTRPADARDDGTLLPFRLQFLPAGKTGSAQGCREIRSGRGFRAAGISPPGGHALPAATARPPPGLAQRRSRLPPAGLRPRAGDAPARRRLRLRHDLASVRTTLLAAMALAPRRRRGRRRARRSGLLRGARRGPERHPRRPSQRGSARRRIRRRALQPLSRAHSRPRRLSGPRPRPAQAGRPDRHLGAELRRGDLRAVPRGRGGPSPSFLFQSVQPEPAPRGAGLRDRFPRHPSHPRGDALHTARLRSGAGPGAPSGRGGLLFAPGLPGAGRPGPGRRPRSRRA